MGYVGVKLCIDQMHIDCRPPLHVLIWNGVNAPVMVHMSVCMEWETS